MKRYHPTTNTARLAVTAILLLAMLCRGVWAVELAQHDSAPLVDPIEIALQHGHYHPPTLNHLHDDSVGISDEDHPLVHVVLALDHQGILMPQSARAPAARHGLLATPTLALSPPYRIGPYRPPRQRFSAV